MANSIITIDLITKEAIELFKNSNSFLMSLDTQYEAELVVLGSAAILAKNPTVSRRFWEGWL